MDILPLKFEMVDFEFCLQGSKNKPCKKTILKEKVFKPFLESFIPTNKHTLNCS